MKIYLKTNVFDEALNRVRRIFDEFEEVIVGFSGGKDSTVVLNLALMVAKEKNRLPLTVLFVDQEAEWGKTIDYVRRVMYRPDINPAWLQVPFRLSNNATTDSNSEWLYCWDKNDKDKWIHPKDPISIHENTFGTERFSEMFYGFIKTTYPFKKTATLGGVRTEESPTRHMSLTSSLSYKEITWGKKDSEKDFVFYPIYDWTWQDVWKAIHENKWDYNDVYNQLFRYGVTPSKMRVSSLCHETSIANIVYVIQEVERDTWNKLCERLSGFNSFEKIDKKEMIPKELPHMFNSWIEYRDYLVEHLVSEIHRDKFRKKFKSMDVWFKALGNECGYFKTCLKTIVTNDFEWTALTKFNTRPENLTYLNWQKGKIPESGNKKALELIKIHKERFGDVARANNSVD